MPHQTLQIATLYEILYSLHNLMFLDQVHTTYSSHYTASGKPTAGMAQLSRTDHCMAGSKGYRGNPRFVDNSTDFPAVVYLFDFHAVVYRFDSRRLPSNEQHCMYKLINAWLAPIFTSLYFYTTLQTIVSMWISMQWWEYLKLLEKQYWKSVKVNEHLSDANQHFSSISNMSIKSQKEKFNVLNKFNERVPIANQAFGNRHIKSFNC